MIVLACLGDHVGRLVHPVAHAAPLDAARHRMFIATRMLVSCGALALAPLYLVMGGIPGWLDVLVLAWLVLPLTAVAQVSNTGKLLSGEVISLATWFGLGTTVALGRICGLGPACALFLVMAFEAAFSRSPRLTQATAAVMTAVVLGLLACIAAGLVAMPPAGPTDPLVYAFVGVYAAVLSLYGAEIRRIGQDLEGLDARRYRVLSETIGDLVLRYDRSGGVLAASGAAERHFGIKPKELMGRGFFERVHVADRPAFLKAVGDAAATAADVTASLRFRVSSVASDDGAYQEPVFAWIEFRTRQLDQEDLQDGQGGREPVVVGVVRDITQRVRHEAEVERAKQEAVDASAWKDRFIANISHELRTPLNSIIGFGEMLANDALTPRDPAKRREYAEIIHTSGHHLLAVVNSLLDLSKLDAGKFELLCEPFDLGALLQSCCDMMRLKADEAAIVLHHDIPPALDDITGDRRACKQIVLNLLSNALKFTPPGGQVSVVVRPDGNAVAISVVDTGIGIVARDMQRLGDPFFQAHSAHDRPYEGTGLGLSVVKGLVGLHGGTIGIESAPGEGTRITVRLPLDLRRVQTTPGQRAKIDVVARYSRAAASHPTPDHRKVQKIA